MSKAGVLIAAVSLLCLDALLLAQTSRGHYRITNKIHVDGDGGWDYITADDSTGRLFVSHGTVVQVVDAKTGKIAGTNGVHGIALARNVNKGFTSDGRDTAITVFDCTTLKVLQKVRVTGINPDAIVYDAFSHSVLAFNGKSSNATVIDAKTDKVTATIPLDGKPEFPAPDGHGSLYVNIEDRNVVEVIDTKTMKIERKFSIAPGESPTGLALDAAADRLFVGCGNKLLVIADAKAGKVLTSLPIGDHVDAVAFDPLYKRAYASCGDGTLTMSSKP
ncbi:MAG TPA: hypothetical protein VKF42_07850 [Chitinivibrionales bacterium]|jgi:YVTN family beta-propeller protein|nr:hypothetical protein [Chitinivibrionales bacterium]